MIPKYTLEFILHVFDISQDAVKNSLSEFSEDIRISACPDNSTEAGQDLEVKLSTLDPELVFDVCSQLGRIKTVKINEG